MGSWIFASPCTPVDLTISTLTFSAISISALSFSITLSTVATIPPEVITKSNYKSIELAKHLNSTGAIMYSAYWCPHCHDQKELFGKEAVSELVIIECAIDGKNNKNELCQKKGITGYPSWEINGTIDSGVKTLEELAELSGYTGERNF